MTPEQDMKVIRNILLSQGIQGIGDIIPRRYKVPHAWQTCVSKPKILIPACKAVQKAYVVLIKQAAKGKN
jgi:hypothetical protein